MFDFGRSSWSGLATKTRKNTVISPRLSTRSRLQSFGFSLLEVLLAVSIAIALGSLQLGQIKRSAETSQAQAVGEQLRMVGTALNSYITLRYGNLVTLTSVAAPGTSSDPGPRTCDAGTGICTITSDTLRRNGLLPNSFSGRNAYGATYEYYIRVTGTAPNWQVDGLVVTSTPYTVGANPRFDLIGQAMLTAGADSGTTRTIPTRVDGFNGGWAETGFPTSSVGQLAYRAGYGTSGFASFLRLDGTSQMTGDLDMGANDIEDVGNITASGDVRTGRLITENRSDAILVGDDANGTIIGTGAGNMQIRNTAGVQILDRTTNTPRPLLAGDTSLGNVSSSGSGTFTNNLAAGTIQSTTGDISSAGNVVANSGITAGGTISTVDGDIFTTNGNISAGGSVSVGTVVNIGTTTIQANRWEIGAFGGGWFMDDATYMKTVNEKGIYTGAGDIWTLGQVRAGSVLADNYIQITGAQVAGAACAANGRIARDATGQTLACVNNVWDLAGGINNTTTTSGLASTGTSTATCPAGYRVSGGGFRFVTRPTINDPTSPQRSYPNIAGNSWVVESGGVSTFQAEALCIQ